MFQRGPRNEEKKANRWGGDKSQRGSKEIRCFKCNEAGHFKQECLLWKKSKGGERKDSNSLDLVIVSEELDELLMVLEEPTECKRSEMASKGSIE